MIVIPFTNAGKITAKDSAVHALTQWANDCERKLLIGMSCGTVLPRERHRAWAGERIKGARFAVRRKGRCVSGYVLLPTANDLITIGGE